VIAFINSLVASPTPSAASKRSVEWADRCYVWACRVGWTGGGHCRIGRVRVENQYAEDGYTYYGTHITTRHC
jgi:hypothetical protein